MCIRDRIGGVGIVKDISAHRSGSVNKNDVYYLVGKTDNKSTALALVTEISLDQVENVNIKVNLEEEKRNGQFILDLFHKKLISSAHDVSDGGIALALCELAIVNGLGFRIIEGSLEYFFNETQGRYIISINPLNEKQLIYLAKEKKVTLNKLGVAEGTTLSFGSNILQLDHAINLYDNAISNMMDIGNR